MVIEHGTGGGPIDLPGLNETGEASAAWLLLFTGITFTPSCPATTPPSAPASANPCPPTPGYAMTVIADADADGAVLAGRTETGGTPPPT